MKKSAFAIAAALLTSLLGAQNATAADWNKITVVHVVSIGINPMTGNYFVAADAPLCTNGSTVGYFDDTSPEGGKSRTLSVLLAMQLSGRKVMIYTHIVDSACRVQFMETL